MKRETLLAFLIGVAALWWLTNRSKGNRVERTITTLGENIRPLDGGCSV